MTHSTSSQTVLVLGATGKTGRRLITHLTSSGATVRAASRKRELGLTPFDWANPATFGPALKGVDAVYLVPPDFVEDPSETVSALLATAQGAGVSRVVALSSLGLTFPDEPAHSGRIQVEHAITMSGLDWTLLRPSGFAQNFSEGFLLPGILQDNIVASVTGDGRVPLIDADDIARVAAVILTESGHAGMTYAITGPEALSFPEAVAIVNGVSGRQIQYLQITPEEFTERLLTFGIPADYAAMVVRDQVAIRDGHATDVTSSVLDITGVPPTPFADYAKQSAAVWHPGVAVAAV